ncbi:endonuclease/exonuclease/phosphatase family protein [Marinobacterium weihaiense]|uniref:Endonuclease/exonuclease/phosphatase family protein n=1 Tax=Marinobacterium weihaiense TaxID=2851016 RepID=A0ABS6MGC3_9GAMM|nr:endonuclease/exonuclease/phosphatase family protein [Marinobacterium weihaiense]MBV0934909.1 endonuclease/exonuclease/phosphatase family protein [Marinobacterium weihaiense]
MLHPTPDQLTSPHTPTIAAPSAQPGLKLLSFNIQVGIRTQAYHHYLTRSWQHLLPHRHRSRTLKQIARLLRQYDLVALQEVDGGSLRSGFVNQVEYLANAGQFPYWYQQLNRNFGKLAQHSNGVLSRYRPTQVEDHALPGLIPGRGAILVRFGEGPQALLIIVLHLALGARTQDRQLRYIRELIEAHPHVILMGDMNNPLEHLLNRPALRGLNLISADESLPTYPSWQPRQALDHILISPDLELRSARVLDYNISDHRPVAMEIGLPPALQQQLQSTERDSEVV